MILKKVGRLMEVSVYLLQKSDFI